jgi:phosphoribosylglycinamide formyltransferase-1
MKLLRTKVWTGVPGGFHPAERLVHPRRGRVARAQADDRLLAGRRQVKAGFVSEPIHPAGSSYDTRRMASGEPGLPSAFEWRGRQVLVAGVLRTWKDTGPCRHGSGERYVRRHWYEVQTGSDGVMTLYFERQPPRKRGAARWWLFSVRPVR